MYAGHDGNVYKNTGSGWQQSNGSGGWSNVNSPQNQQKAQQNAQSYQQQHPSGQAQSQQYKQQASQYHPSGGGSTGGLDSDRANRMSGSEQSHSYDSGARSGGGFGGGGRSWGGGGGERRGR
jgi:hypothetical protein